MIIIYYFMHKLLTEKLQNGMNPNNALSIFKP